MSTPLICLDRLMSSLSPSIGKAYSFGQTVFTLPYPCPVDGTEGELVLVSGDSQSGYAFGTVIPSLRPSETTIAVAGPNLVAFEVFIGVPYSFEYELSTIYPRKDRTNAPAVAETRGKLQLRNIIFDYTAAGVLTATVQGAERVAASYSTEAQEEDVDGQLRVPVLSNNRAVTITLTNDSPLGCRIHQAEWEGHYYIRNRSR